MQKIQMRGQPRSAAPRARALLVACMLVGAGSAAWSQPAAPQVAATVEVSGFTVQGNTLLPMPDIQARLESFKGPVSVQRLRDAAAAVQDLYRRAGFGGVVAFLPEQTLGSGVVLIRVVEGKLDRIDISGQQQFSVENVLASLPDLVTGRTPNVRRIDAQIQLANESPAKTVQVLLQPGATPGTVAAKLTVAEQPVQRWTARADNTGSRANGRWRAALGWQHGNVLGQDHVFSTEWQTAPEDVSGVAVLSAAYRMPLYRQSMALDAYGAYSDVSSAKTATAAGDLQFSGRGHIVGARGTLYLPRWDTVDQRVSLGLETRDYLNDCSIAGLPQGACGSAGASVALQPLSLAYTAQAGGDLRAGGSVSLHHNLALGGSHTRQADFEAVRPGAVRRYTLLRASGQLALPVQDWGTLALRVSAQASGQPLVPGELFGLGGAQSVRGFEERELAGDSGLQASVEFSSPNLATQLPSLKDAELRVLLFADGGQVSSLKDAPCLPGQTRCHMASVGAGLRLAYQQAQLRLDVGVALSDATTTQRGDTRVHLGLIVSF